MTKSGKIDKRIKYLAVFDTETAGSLDNPLVYDIGVTICDKRGKIYSQQEWIVKEIFDNKKMMHNAYYGSKRPMYVEKISNREMRKVPFKVMKTEFNNLLQKWNVKAILAYNLKFDMRALTSTTKYLHSQYQYDESRKFLRMNLQIQDIWGLACETLYKQKGFHLMINTWGFYTPARNPQTSAEIGYRYITGDMEFSENHTALSDTEIEVAIMAKCFRQNKKFTKGIISHPWRIVANQHKGLY
ncbi:MAG: hypothetical protein KQ78_01811 [Candidatus Izimaplasma bacterium HR2]|nr:MAG: hypothetical protein KQ78_01811 [Candidatus Izimaplasma bacterium HR2]